MLSGSKQRLCSIPDQHLSIKLHGQVVECVNEFRCLGVVIDNCLDFKKHVDYISKTIRQKLGIIRRSKHFFNDPQLSKLYWGYVIPHILYCCNVWQARTQGGGGGFRGFKPPPPFGYDIYIFLFFLLVTPEVGLVDGRYPYPIM